jgi:hypothetical protein
MASAIDVWPINIANKRASFIFCVSDLFNNI